MNQSLKPVNWYFSGFQKFHTYFLKGDEAHYADHNFSTGYKLNASGYMSLESKNSDNHVTVDKKGRARFNYPRTGTLYITLRGNKFFRATTYNHYDDLFPIVADAKKAGKHSLVIICDNGPDWKKNSLKVAIVIGRLWRDLDLDYVCVVSYCAGDSRFNMIEHAWSPTNTWLTGLCLSDTIPGETLPPDRQTNLSEEERLDKEKTVLDAAIDKVKQCLEDRTFDGFPVVAKGVPCGSKHMYDDEEDINELSKAQLTIINKNEHLQQKAKEFQFLQRHSIQRRYTLEFIKCEDRECDHCSTHPVQSVKLVTFLRETCGCLFPPMRSADQDPEQIGFKSWTQMANDAFNGRVRVPDLDEGLTSQYEHNGVSRCPHSCRKVYQSNADRERHEKLVHRLNVE